jgi:hypothetical protein
MSITSCRSRWCSNQVPSRSFSTMCNLASPSATGSRQRRDQPCIALRTPRLEEPRHLGDRQITWFEALHLQPPADMAHQVNLLGRRPPGIAQAKQILTKAFGIRGQRPVDMPALPSCAWPRPVVRLRVIRHGRGVRRHQPQSGGQSSHRLRPSPAKTQPTRRASSPMTPPNTPTGSPHTCPMALIHRRETLVHEPPYVSLTWLR